MRPAATFRRQPAPNCNTVNCALQFYALSKTANEVWLRDGEVPNCTTMPCWPSVSAAVRSRMPLPTSNARVATTRTQRLPRLQDAVTALFCRMNAALAGTTFEFENDIAYSIKKFL